MVDSMLQYARKDLKGQHDQAMDILATGLNAVSGRSKSRLLIAMSDLEADRSKWDNAADLASQALQAQADEGAGSSNPAEMVLMTRQLARSLFAQVGREDEAMAAVKDGMRLLGGTDEAHGPEGDGAMSGLEMPKEISDLPGAKGLRDTIHSSRDAVWPVLHDSAVLLAAKGRVDEAGAFLTSAEEAAVHGASSSDYDPKLLSPQSYAEAAADVSMTLAQLQMAQKSWDAAEALLSKALERTEAVSGDSHPRVAAPLLLLSECYIRTQRFTLAEGLYRRSLKMLGFVGGGGDMAAAASSHHHKVHPSLGAFACWRFAQMLAVMPKREAEVNEWSACANRLWEAAVMPKTLEASLGELQALKGTVTRGSGALVHLQSQRLILLMGAEESSAHPDTAAGGP